MKLFLAGLAIIGSCLLYTTESSGQEVPSTTPLPDLSPRSFSFNSGDPCTNIIYQILNITDAKCSLSCYKTGFQQGGYCDYDQVCQCILST